MSETSNEVSPAPGPAATAQMRQQLELKVHVVADGSATAKAAPYTLVERGPQAASEDGVAALDKNYLERQIKTWAELLPNRSRLAHRHDRRQSGTVRRSL